MKIYNPKYKQTVIYVGGDDLESINRALNRLRHESAPLMKELKMKRYHEPNTAKRRRKLKEAIARERMKMRKLEMYG
jgi:ribosomal protein S21